MGHVHRVARPARGVRPAASLFLSLLFLAVYGTAAWITSLRGDVGSWAFEWERKLPLVPSLIVPYLSIDLFFVGAPLLCATATELRSFCRRMTAAILAAGAVFLMMPLQFAGTRPEPAGWAGPIFGLLHTFDRPSNMFPSLHIAILMILAGTYDRHTRGGLKVLVHAWFVLIACSTVLTGQHHAVDVVGGFALALGCYYLIPEYNAPPAITANPRIGVSYALGAAVLAGVSAWLGPWGIPLLWPALSLAIAAGAYFGLYGGLTRKHGGRLPLAARIILAPWLLGQRLSWMYYRSHCLPWDIVAPNVWIGRRLNPGEAATAVKLGVTAVLDLTAESSEAPPFLSLEYLNLPILDLTAPTSAQLRAAVDFISAHRGTGAVYVHCKIGYSRSAAVVAAWLLEVNLAATPDAAVAMVRAARPTLIVRPEAWAALCEYSMIDRRIRRLPAAGLLEVRT